MAAVRVCWAFCTALLVSVVADGTKSPTGLQMRNRPTTTTKSKIRSRTVILLERPCFPGVWRGAIEAQLQLKSENETSGKVYSVKLYINMLMRCLQHSHCVSKTNQSVVAARWEQSSQRLRIISCVHMKMKYLGVMYKSVNVGL